MSDPAAASGTTTATFRTATPADVGAIQHIYAHHVLNGTGTFEVEAPSVAEMNARYDALVQAGYPYVVAEAAGRVVGYGYAGPFRARPAYRYTVEDSIYLHPDWTGRGIGRQLLERLITESAGRGFTQMLAVIGDSANTGSIRVHRATGFVHIGVFKDVGYKFNRWLDVIMMQRALR